MLAARWLWIIGGGLLGVFLLGVVLGQTVPDAAGWMLILVPSGSGHWVIPWPLVLGIATLWVAVFLRAQETRRGQV